MNFISTFFGSHYSLSMVKSHSKARLHQAEKRCDSSVIIYALYMIDIKVLVTWTSHYYYTQYVPGPEQIQVEPGPEVPP